MRTLLAALVLTALTHASMARAATLLLALDRTRAAEFASLEVLLDPAASPSPFSTVAVEMIGLNKSVGDPIHVPAELPKLLEAATGIAHQPATLSLPASLAKVDRRLAALEDDRRRAALEDDRRRAALGDNRRVVVILSDLDLADPNTHGKALGDGWITNPASPLAREWLGKDANGFKNADIIVLTRAGEALSMRRMREGFFAKAFARVEAKLRYFGPAPRGQDAMVFARDLLAATLANTLEPIVPPPLGSSPILQLVDQTGATGNVEIATVPTR